MNPPRSPIVFVHGNGACAAFWMSLVSRFAANGVPLTHLRPMDFSRPIARSSGVDAHDLLEVPGRSSTEEQLAELARAIDEAREATGAPQVTLIGHSRGGNAIRNYLWSVGPGFVDRVVLAGATTHGLLANPHALLDNEFNREGRFLKRLDAHPTDLPPGLPVLSLRSDTNDLWFQPDGRFLGLPGRPTGIGHDAPDVREGENVVLPGADHKQVALGDDAFVAMHRFLMGRAPEHLHAPAERAPRLDGIVTAFQDGAPSNRPVAGAQVEVFALDPLTGERLRGPVHVSRTGADGRWGPCVVDPAQPLEFVLTVPGFPKTFITRPPFLQSSALVRLAPLVPTREELEGEGWLVIRRPRGLSGAQRDVVQVDGEPARPRPDGVYRFWLDANERVPGIAAHAVPRAAGVVQVSVNGVRVPVRARPRSEGLVVAEFHA